jgi:hypothetical protein
MRFARSRILLGTLAAVWLTAAKTPEQQTLEVSRVLKPLSDERWQEIAKDQLGQQYEIIKGDTLWGISQRLFGEGNYWPKIWALNGQSIPNPHWIFPGAKLVFVPGSATSLPGMRIADASGAAAVADGVAGGTATDAPRSQQWRDLPIQPWEQIQITLPPEVDAQGFDLRGRYVFPKSEGFDLQLIAQTEELPVLGRVLSADSENQLLVADDTVFLEPENDGSLEPGKILTLTRKPETLNPPGLGRNGLLYRLDGRVLVLGERNGAWVGRILSSSNGAERKDSLLVDLPVRGRLVPPVAATEALEAVLLNDNGGRVSTLVQHQFAFINRGSEDGVVPGMVFRAYKTRDPSSEQALPADKVSTLGECAVVDVTAGFSTVLITSSEESLADGTPVFALTDVSSIGVKRRMEVKELDGPTDGKPSNELDGLEEDGSLTDEERRNLKQLERKQEEPAPNLEETPMAPVPEPTDEPPTEEAPAEPETTPEEAADPESAPEESAPEEPSADEDTIPSEDSTAEETAPSEPAAEPEAPPDF